MSNGILAIVLLSHPVGSDGESELGGLKNYRSAGAAGEGLVNNSSRLNLRKRQTSPILPPPIQFC